MAIEKVRKYGEKSVDPNEKQQRYRQKEHKTKRRKKHDSTTAAKQPNKQNKLVKRN